MPGSPTITVRPPTDVIAALDSFIESDPAWTRSELVTVAVHAFLKSAAGEKDRALLEYRRRLQGATAPGSGSGSGSGSAPRPGRGKKGGPGKG